MGKNWGRLWQLLGTVVSESSHPQPKYSRFYRIFRDIPLADPGFPRWGRKDGVRGGGSLSLGVKTSYLTRFLSKTARKWKWIGPLQPHPLVPPMHLTRFRLSVFAPIRNLGFATDYQVSSITNEKSFKVKLVNLCSMGLMY